MENKNAPEVDNLLNNETTGINTVEIANDGEASRTTKNNELEPIQIRTCLHELIRTNMTQVKCSLGKCELIRPGTDQYELK